MSDPRVARLARVLVEYSIDVRPGDCVVLAGELAGAPLIVELYRAALAAGGMPEIRVILDELEGVLLELGADEQLAWTNPTMLEGAERCDCRARVLATANTRSLSRSDPARQAMRERALAPVLDTLLARGASGELRSVVTAFPTQALAQEAGMSLAAYERFVYEACLLDRDDPVAAWRALGDSLERVRELLAAAGELRIVAAGTDLTVPVAGRTWLVSAGRENMPDGEVFTAPHDGGVEGEISFSFPALFAGRVVEGARLVFAGGEVVEATARRGADFLREMVALDAGSRRLGEVAFGLNEGIQRATGEALFDEKIAGTVHVALGKAYAECDGTNQSALHWDLVCDLRQGGEVYADGRLVYRDGRFLDAALAPSP